MSTVYVECVYSVCPVYVQCMYSVYTVYVQCIYGVYTVYAQCIYTVCTVYVQCKSTYVRTCTAALGIRRIDYFKVFTMTWNSYVYKDNIKDGNSLILDQSQVNIDY